MYRKSRPSRGSLNSISFVLETKFSYSSDETTINKLNIEKLNDFIFFFQVVNLDKEHFHQSVSWLVVDKWRKE